MKRPLIHICYLIIIFLLIISGCTPGSSGNNQQRPLPNKNKEEHEPQDMPDLFRYTYRVVNSYPHDREAFTQGLFYYQGFLYESTGLTGHSTLRKTNLETGEVLQKLEVPDIYFAEGMTIFRDKIYQLTWLHNKGFIYDLASFQKLQEFSYQGEGWGLTHNEKFLIMSDGTSQIRFLDPETLAVDHTISVTYGQRRITNINELEFIDGQIFANIWQTDQIVRIEPKNGRVTGIIDLTGLLSADDQHKPVDVLNGIAFDAENDRLFVTGKLWPKIFEIKLVRQ